MIDKVFYKAPEHSHCALMLNQRQLMQYYVIYDNMFNRLQTASWESAKFMNEAIVYS